MDIDSLHKIKYRGKRIDSNQFEYGYLSFFYVDGKNENGYIYTDKARLYSPDKAQSFEINANTIGISVGIEDINKKEIFTGDVVEIVIYDHWNKQRIASKRCVVEFANGIFGVMYDKGIELQPFSNFFNTTFEIVRKYIC